MFKALVWKEWRQLALVRWGGIALGGILPIAFTAGAELAQRGLLPTGSVTAYKPRDLMFELLPAALAMGLWPLIGLMSAAQAFTGDRAAGTETFLLERPVSRTIVWSTRLFATLLTVAVVIAGTGAIAAIAAALTGAPPGIGWSRWELLAALGVGLALLAVLGSVIASSLQSSPMGTVLLGAIAGAVPVVLAAELRFFEYARIGAFHLGVVVPLIVLPAYVAVSWVTSCRGEPAGRARARRSGTLIGTAFVGALVLFLALAPIVVRANAAAGQHAIDPGPSGTAFVISANSNGTSGWIVDVATGTKGVFVPPPIRVIDWSPDGSEVAVQTWSGPLGSLRGERIDVRSTADGRVLRTIPVKEGVLVHDLAWADAGIVAIVSRESSDGAGEIGVEIIDPLTGVWRSTGFRWQGWPVELVGPGENGRVFLRVWVGAAPGEGSEVLRGHRLFPIDVAAAGVGAAITDANGRSMIFAGWRDGLSPSGRYARVVPYEGASGGPRMIDVPAGAVLPDTASPRWAQWIASDLLVSEESLAHTTRMFIEIPGASPLAIREWRDAQVGLEPSPDAHAVFVSVLPAGSAPVTDPRLKQPDVSLFAGTAPKGAVPEELVYLSDEARFVTVGPAFSARPNDHRSTTWAGPRTLARISPGVVYFEDIATPGKLRFVIGGPGDLE